MTSITHQTLAALNAEWAELDSREGLLTADVQRLFDLGMEIERRTKTAAASVEG